MEMKTVRGLNFNSPFRVKPDPNREDVVLTIGEDTEGGVRHWICCDKPRAVGVGLGIEWYGREFHKTGHDNLTVVYSEHLHCLINDRHEVNGYPEDLYRKVMELLFNMEDKADAYTKEFDVYYHDEERELFFSVVDDTIGDFGSDDLKEYAKSVR